MFVGCSPSRILNWFGFLSFVGDLPTEWLHVGRLGDSMWGLSWPSFAVFYNKMIPRWQVGWFHVGSVLPKLVGDFPNGYKPTITTHGTVDDTNLSQILSIKNGARVMLVLNVNTLDSLVNGSLGIIEDIITENDGKVKSLIIFFVMFLLLFKPF